MSRYGSREVCDVVLRAKATQMLGSRKFYKGEPVIYFDTLKTSGMEGAATTVYANGGKGNPRLLSWDGDRTLTFTFEDALISPESFAILSGADLIDSTEAEPIYVHTTSRVEVKDDNKVVLDYIACWTAPTGTDAAKYTNANAEIYIMALDEAGLVAGEPCIPHEVKYVDGKTEITCDKAKAGKVVLVDCYVKKIAGTQQIEITADKFGGSYYLEGDTLFRREADGVDLPAIFVIPNGRIQSNFNFALSNSGDPSTFTFTMDAFPDYTRFDQTKKVLACIQIVDEAAEAEEDDKRKCGLDQGE